MERGLIFGVALQKLTYKPGHYRVHVFTEIPTKNSPSLMMRHAQSGDWSTEELSQSLSPILALVKQYRENIHSLQTFALAAAEDFAKFHGITSLYEWIFAHYLNVNVPLPTFQLTEAEICQYAQVERPFEFDLLKEVLALKEEWSSEQYELFKARRISDWLSDRKLPFDLFECQVSD